MDKKKVFIWSLYDFANSIVMIAFFLYFSQWLVIDKGVSDFWFNLSFTISSLFLLLTGPVAGAVADKTNNKISGLRWTTVFSVLFFFVTGLITVLYSEHYYLAAISFTIASYFYLFSFVYYNAMLPDLAQGNQGLVSGWGIFGNYLGQITAILIALPFVNGFFTIGGESGRAQVFLPATIAFFILSLPMLVFYREKKNNLISKPSWKNEYRSIWQSLIQICRTPYLGAFFLAYFFFNDAIITASNNFPIYMDRVFGLSDSIKSYILLGIMLTSAIGAPASGWLADRIGLKKTLMTILAGWVIIFPLLAWITNLYLFITVTLIMGLWFGSIWTVTRALVSALTPHNLLNRSFTYYTLIERFATFIGPLSWGLIIMYGPIERALNYRLAALAMTIFVLLGILVARSIPEIEHKPQIML